MPEFPVIRKAPGCGAFRPGRTALRCLIVDDSPRFLEAARALLEREGITVVVASTGAEALRRAEELRPDVVLLDIYLGQVSGFDLARRFASETSLHPPSVILISTYAEHDFADLIIASPVAGFLSKPDLSARAILELVADTGGGTADVADESF